MLSRAYRLSDLSSWPCARVTDLRSADDGTTAHAILKFPTATGFVELRRWVYLLSTSYVGPASRVLSDLISLIFSESSSRRVHEIVWPRDETYRLSGRISIRATKERRTLQPNR